MARHRQIRVDWHTHEKTRGLSPLARDLVVQALCANVAAILERSVRRMAATAGGRTSPEDVEEAIGELVERGIAEWWADLDVLWIREAADEQAKGAKAWEGAEAIAAAAPDPVRRAFARRYRDRLSDRFVRSYRIEEEEAPRGRSGAPPLPAPAPVPVPVPAPARASAAAQSTDPPGQAAPAPVLRNQPPDERDLDDPEVRSLGDVVSADGLGAPTVMEPHELELRRAVWAATLPDDQRLRVAPLTRDGRTAEGIQVAVRTYGRKIVWEVLRWSWAEAAAGRLEPKLLACTFRGSGFDARLEAWRKAQEHERRRARFGLQRETEAVPLPDHGEFFGLADKLADATERLRRCGSIADGHDTTGGTT